LTAVTDDSTGTVQLSWTAAEGRFAEYLVLRTRSDLSSVDTLARMYDTRTVSFTDTVSLLSQFTYRVSVVTRDGLEASSNEVNPRAIKLQGVVIQDLRFDAATATATVRWTVYNGPRFEAYEVWRSSREEGDVLVGEVRDASSTSIVDRGLHGDRRYSYRVEVLTLLAERLPGVVKGGGIHEWLSSWPMEIPDSASVRLYVEEPGQLSAIVNEGSRVRLLHFSQDGVVIDDSEVIDVSPVRFRKHSVSTARDPVGRRLTSFAIEEDVRTAGRTASGMIAASNADFILFEDAGPSLRTDALFQSRLDVDLETSSSGGGFATALAFLHRMAVVADGIPVVTLDPSSDPTGLQGDLVEDGRVVLERSGGELGAPTTLRYSGGQDWQSVTYQATLSIVSGRTVVTLGSRVSPTYARVSFTMRPESQSVEMAWAYIGDDRNTGLAISPFPLLPGFPFSFSAELGAGTQDIRATTPVYWSEFMDTPPEWASTVSLGDVVGLATGATARSFAADGSELRSLHLDGPVAEIRTWESPTGGDMLGLCMVQGNSIRVGAAGFTATGRIDWPTSTDGAAIGAGLGNGDGELTAPLSFDVSRGGRFYGLDAGNSRIQVFDTEGNYLTQWGHKGATEGEFDFLGGQTYSDLAGSIAVDDDGFIYVADVGNRRIQKFAP